MRFFIIIVIVIFSSSNADLQARDYLAEIEDAYVQFNFDQVIILGQQAIQDSLLTNKSTRTEIQRYMAMAYYSLGEMGPSYRMFYQVLKNDKAYQLDPVITPPKIYRFFNEIKKTYPDNREAEVITVTDTIYISGRPEPNSQLYSLMLPGTGHLREGYKTRGWIITSLALVSLSSSIYLISETNKREKDYLSAIDPSEIEKKYKKYNDAFRLRNWSLAFFAGIWMYAQIDLLYFSSSPHSSTSGFRVQGNFKNLTTPEILLSYHF